MGDLQSFHTSFFSVTKENVWPLLRNIEKML